MPAHRISDRRSPSGAARMRRMHQDGVAMGPPSDLPDVRRHALLRLVAESPCLRARPLDSPSRCRVRRSRRALAVLLSGRRLRRVLTSLPRSVVRGAGSEVHASLPRSAVRDPGSEVLTSLPGCVVRDPRSDRTADPGPRIPDPGQRQLLLTPADPRNPLLVVRPRRRLGRLGRAFGDLLDRARELRIVALRQLRRDRRPPRCRDRRRGLRRTTALRVEHPEGRHRDARRRRRAPARR